jgi:hypothetical protein
MDFEAIDLRQDARASCYVKDETVQVVFAHSAPAASPAAKAPNRYAPGMRCSPAPAAIAGA